MTTTIPPQPPGVAIEPSGRASRRTSLGEFELIARHFARAPRRTQVALGVGDDCALLAPAPGMQLVVTTDL
ncbi:MAG TPA: hypothetical protein PLT38_01385, partial [Rubrivivax sp.]|nr:hypothetical protein [Rubrivivax sp.]